MHWQSLVSIGASAYYIIDCFLARGPIFEMQASIAGYQKISPPTKKGRLDPALHTILMDRDQISIPNLLSKQLTDRFTLQNFDSSYIAVLSCHQKGICFMYLFLGPDHVVYKLIAAKLNLDLQHLLT